MRESMDMVGGKMRYAIIENGIVKNIVVSEPDFAESKGWVEVTAGALIGGTYIDGVFGPAPPGVEPISFDVLATDKWSIQADETDYATITYTSETDVHFVVDGAVYVVTPVDSVATLEITADAPGAIQVQARDKQLVITAMEVAE